MIRPIAKHLRTGLEVRRLRGVGWSVCSTRNGNIMDRLRTFITADEADRVARELHADIALGIIEIEGAEPYLKLSREAGAL